MIRLMGGMYVGGTNSPQVSVINTASNADVKDLPMPAPAVNSEATGLAHNTNNNRIYITAYSYNTAGIAYNPSNNHIYVANVGSNTVSIIHP